MTESSVAVLALCHIAVALGKIATILGVWVCGKIAVRIGR